MEPLGAVNITKSLFMMDEKLSMKKEFEKNLNNDLNSLPVSDWQSIKENQGTGTQIDAYLNQAAIANWYKNYGTIVLNSNSNYGAGVMGGPINYGREGSLKNPPVPANQLHKNGYIQYHNEYLAVNQPERVDNNIKLKKDEYGIILPSFMSFDPKNSKA